MSGAAQGRIDLGGKLALVPGAGAGMGTASAHAIASAGSMVVVPARDKRGAGETAGQIRVALGQAHVQARDVSSEAEWRSPKRSQAWYCF